MGSHFSACIPLCKPCLLFPLEALSGLNHIPVPGHSDTDVWWVEAGIGERHGRERVSGRPGEVSGKQMPAHLVVVSAHSTHWNLSEEPSWSLRGQKLEHWPILFLVWLEMMPLSRWEVTGSLPG